MPQAVRIDDELIELARAETVTSNRSIGAQIETWAKIGRAIERAPGFDYSKVQAVLRAAMSRDELTGEEQAVYDEEFMDRMAEPSDVEETFFEKMRAEGRGVGLDADDNLVYGENEPSRPG